MPSDLYFSRLNIAAYATQSAPNRWAFFAESGMIECAIHGRLMSATVSLSGDHGIVAIKRCTGVEWSQVEHGLYTWFLGRPEYRGWLLEMQCQTEVAA